MIWLEHVGGSDDGYDENDVVISRGKYALQLGVHVSLQ